MVSELEDHNKQLGEERANFRKQCKELILSENELTARLDSQKVYFRMKLKF